MRKGSSSIRRPMASSLPHRFERSKSDFEEVKVMKKHGGKKEKPWKGQPTGKPRPQEPGKPGTSTGKQ